MLLPRLLSTSSLRSSCEFPPILPLFSQSKIRYLIRFTVSLKKTKIIQHSGSGYSRFSFAAPFSRLSSTKELVLSPSFLPSLPHGSSTLQYMGTEPYSRATGGIVAIYDFGIEQPPHVPFFKKQNTFGQPSRSYRGYTRLDVISHQLYNAFDTLLISSRLYRNLFFSCSWVWAAKQCNLYIDGNSLVQTDFSRSLSVHL